VTFERYSDSAGAFVTLDSSNPSVYKQLYRAAKAKLKLRIRATITEQPSVKEEEEEDEPEVTSSTPILSGERYTPPTPSVRPPSIKTLVNEQSEAPSRVIPIQIQDVKGPGQSFSVFCNECDKSIPGPHWHCSICEEGDYDLCRECVGSGVHCKVDGHFLIKRIVENGSIISSNTQRMQKKPEDEEPAEKEVPGAFMTEKVVPDLPTVCTRICNCCILSTLTDAVLLITANDVVALEESSFVTCTSCEDYDLCLNCLSSNKHGHHPAHVLTPVSKQIFLTAKNMRQCAAGRSFKHAAICDGCDKVC
jgi:next-to-BRCA1 protein 1